MSLQVARPWLQRMAPSILKVARMALQVTGSAPRSLRKSRPVPKYLKVARMALQAARLLPRMVTVPGLLGELRLEDDSWCWPGSGVHPEHQGQPSAGS